MQRPTLFATVWLVFVGWRPGRSVWSTLKLPVHFTPLSAAEEFLAEFGGLKFRRRSEITIFDPSVADEIAAESKRLEALLGRRLYPLGFREHQDREYIFLDEQGVMYICTGDELRPLASSVVKLLDYVTWKTESRREKDRDLTAVGLMGLSWQYVDQLCARDAEGRRQ